MRKSTWVWLLSGSSFDGGIWCDCSNLVKI